MRLKVNTRCAICKGTLDYLDERGVVFRTRRDHDKEACNLFLQDTVSHLQRENVRLNVLVNDERVRLKTWEANHRGRKAETSQEHHLINQCRRWQALYERERMRRYWLKNKIMKVYGTLDLRIESGYIVDSKAKAVAEYATNKLREVLKDSDT